MPGSPPRGAPELPASYLPASTQANAATRSIARAPTTRTRRNQASSVSPLQHRWDLCAVGPGAQGWTRRPGPDLLGRVRVRSSCHSSLHTDAGRARPQAGDPASGRPRRLHPEWCRGLHHWRDGLRPASAPGICLGEPVSREARDEPAQAALHPYSACARTNPAVCPWCNPQELPLGLAVFSCMPTSLSSCVTLTMAVGGNAVSNGTLRS